MSIPIESVPLNSLAKGCRAKIIAAGIKPKVIQKLLSLGIRRGSEIEVLHQRSSGVVICNGNNRVALGADVARELTVVTCGE